MTEYRIRVPIGGSLPALEPGAYWIIVDGFFPDGSPILRLEPEAEGPSLGEITERIDQISAPEGQAWFTSDLYLSGLTEALTSTGHLEEPWAKIRTDRGWAALVKIAGPLRSVVEMARKDEEFAPCPAGAG